jgi:hypothetical protein
VQTAGFFVDQVKMKQHRRTSVPVQKSSSCKKKSQKVKIVLYNMLFCRIMLLMDYQNVPRQRGGDR